jgi:hypothetical protein
MQTSQQLTGPASRRFLHPYGPVPAPIWFLGLDLGQRFDHSALAILHLAWTFLGRCALTYQYLFRPELTVRSVERYPLNASYEEIPRILAMRAGQINERHRANTPHTQPAVRLIIDAGGPGGPMVDHLRRVAPGYVSIEPVMITSGSGETKLSGGFSGIPRRALVTQLVQMVAGGCIECPGALPGVYEWVEEMLSLSGCGAQSGRRAVHDDMTMAAALAAWAAVRDAHELAPGASQSKHCSSRTIGFVDKPLF